MDSRKRPKLQTVEDVRLRDLSVRVSGISEFVLMVVRITIGNIFTLIHICQNILTRHSQPKHSRTFKALHEERGYPKQLIERTISEKQQYLRSIFPEDSRLLKQKAKTTEQILLFVTKYNPVVSILQAILTRSRGRATGFLLKTSH